MGVSNWASSKLANDSALPPFLGVTADVAAVCATGMLRSARKLALLGLEKNFR